MFSKILRFFVIPFSKFLSFFSRLFSQDNALDGYDWENITSDLKKGDVLLTVNKEAWPSNLVQKISTGGRWFHAGIYVGDGYMVEATDKGVLHTHLFDFMKDKDDIALISPNFLTMSELDTACEVAKSKIGFGYDWAFNYSNNELFYCSELIMYSYNKALKGKSPFIPLTRYGVETAIPQDLFNADKLFKKIYVSRRKKGKK